MEDINQSSNNMDRLNKIYPSLKVTLAVVTRVLWVGHTEGGKVFVFGGDGDLDRRAVGVLEDYAMEACLQHPITPQPRGCCGVQGLCREPCLWVQLVS